MSGAFDYRPPERGLTTALALPGLRNFKALANATTPNTKYDLSADVICFRDRTGLSVVKYASGTITCDTGASGSIPNGRDRSTAFSASAFVHFYFIWNGTRIATLASPTSPESFTGSTLPAGYTHWCYATSIQLTSGSIFAFQVARGRRVYTAATISASGSQNLSTSEVTCTISSIPSCALRGYYQANALVTHTSANVEFGITIRPSAAGTNLVTHSVVSQVAAVANTQQLPFDMPWLGGTAVYHVATAVPATAGTLSIRTLGYDVPNGDS